MLVAVPENAIRVPSSVGGTLCLVNSHRSLSPVSAGGSPAPADDCTGTFALDMNAFEQGLGGGSPVPALLVPGSRVQCQWWSRDPGFAPPNAIGMTGGAEYTMGTWPRKSAPARSGDCRCRPHA